MGRKVRPSRALLMKRRGFELASDGKPAPTALEIEEGEAWQAWQDNPTEERFNAWRALHWKTLYKQGNISTSRCEFCGVTLAGREAADGCGYCGHRKRIARCQN